MWIGLAARVNSKKGPCAMIQTWEARDATVIEEKYDSGLCHFRVHLCGIFVAFSVTMVKHQAVTSPFTMNGIGQSLHVGILESLSEPSHGAPDRARRF